MNGSTGASIFCYFVSKEVKFECVCTVYTVQKCVEREKKWITIGHGNSIRVLVASVSFSIEVESMCVAIPHLRTAMFLCYFMRNRKIARRFTEATFCTICLFDSNQFSHENHSSNEAPRYRISQ